MKPFTVIPPSTHIVYPVMYEAAGRHKNATKEDTSLGSPMRPIGVREIIALKRFSSAKYYNQKRKTKIICN